MNKETELFPPIKNWLKERGYKIYSEIATMLDGLSPVDVIGIRGKELIMIEMKLCLSKVVIRQAYNRNLIADKVYCAINSKPKQKGIDGCAKSNIGILQVTDIVKVVLEPDLNKKRNHEPWRDDFIEKCKNYGEAENAGFACSKGAGSTYMIIDKIKEYRKLHPKAGWLEIWENVDNHYNNHKTMASSLNKWRGYSLRQ